MVFLENPISESLHLPIMYPTLISIGMVFCFLIAIYKFEIKRIDWTWIMVIAAIITVFSLMGASFAGKIGFFKKGDGFVEFLKLFAFWEEGLAIHGGIITWFILFIPAGLWAERKYKISIWAIADIVFQNVLIAQALGRWGNFFNHELLGPEAGEYGKSLMWLPEWLRANTASANGYGGNGTQYHPIFLYESVGLLLAWIILISTPYILRAIRKPTKLHPDQFSYNTKDSFKKLVLIKKEYEHSYLDIWNKAYFFNENEDQKQYYLEKVAEIESNEKWNKVQKAWYKGKAYEQANNPDNYLSLKSGVVFSWYIFSWNAVRIGLEAIKDDGILFIKFNKPLSVGLISLFAFLGLLSLIWFQFFAPKFLRKQGYIYEKKYFTITQ